MHEQLEKVISLCKRRGFIYPGSDIYGGLANSWDYAPYGVQLKKNIQDFWWKTFVERREDILGLDSSILMNSEVWAASGHTERFFDWMIDNKDSKKRYRLDKFLQENAPEINVEAMTPAEQYAELIKRNIKCPSSKTANWTDPKEFNLMLETHLGVIKEHENKSYLRPETAQGIFINFKNITSSTRARVPFGIAQIGKAFRNEITPGNFIFRTREFEQMEIEYFFKPTSPEETKVLFEKWKKDCFKWLTDMGIKEENLRFRDHESKELSHYSTMTTDIEYNFPFGWGELSGLAYRGCFDLSQHEKFSKKDLKYLDPLTNEKYLPEVIEPSFGANRTLLTILCDAYQEDEIEGEKRVVLKLSPKIAPVKAAILPLMKKDELEPTARKLHEKLLNIMPVEYDNSGAIGKRYRRQDEIGTPFAVTVDYDSIQDQQVTIRERDTLQQHRLPITKVAEFLIERISA